MTEGLPLILSDETNSYIYGPGGIPVEQVSSGGTVTYLHHDRQGSTRMLTSSTGISEGTMTYDAYGNKTGGAGTATTSLGYDAQYTNGDGLIYLRARAYDPATAHVKPLGSITSSGRALHALVRDQSPIKPNGLRLNTTPTLVLPSISRPKAEPNRAANRSPNATPFLRLKRTTTAPDSLSLLCPTRPYRRPPVRA